MDSFIQEIICGDGPLTFIVTIALIFKYIVTMLFLLAGIAAFNKYVTKD